MSKARDIANLDFHNHNLDIDGGTIDGATIDSRNVGTDGTKLDTIETNADVTETTNVVAALSAGTGIGLSAGGAISNTAPDQTVALTGAGTTSVSGTYPDFTITGAGTTYTAGGGLSLTGTEFANTAPDQTVALTGSGATSISGTYPNFTISSVNTTYSVGDGGLSQINFTSADHTKLNGIEASATADQTAAQIKTLLVNGLTATHLAAGSVGASEIGNDVVNSQHYAAGSIDNEHIADNAINSEHYADGSIDNAHIADNAINSEHYADNSIDALHLNVSGNGTTSQYLRSDGDGTFSWVTPPNTNTTYSVGNGGLTQQNFTNADHTKLNGIATSANNYSFPYTIATTSTGNAVARRDASGDINARLFRSEYDSTNASCNYFMTQVDTASNNYMRPSTPAQVRSALNVENGATADQSSAEIRAAMQNAGPTFSNVYTDGWYRNNAINEGLFNEATGAHFYASAANEWNMGGGNTHAYLRMRNNHQSTIIGTMHANTSYQHGFLNTSDGWKFFADNSNNFYCYGNITAYYSDTRLKDEQTQLTSGSGLALINQLKVKSFVWNALTEENPSIETGSTEIGLIAQELELLIPNAVVINEASNPSSAQIEKAKEEGLPVPETPDYKTINYDKLIPFLIQAVQDLKAEIETLKRGV